MEKPSLPPIFGWDLLLESHQRLREAGQDLQALKELAARNSWQHRFDFERRLLTNQETIIVTGTDLRIVFATRNMTGMNGYLPHEVIGKIPAMFQGPETDPQVRDHIRRAVAARDPFNAVLVNYRKDGSSYPCKIEGYPVFDKMSNAVHFLAFESVA